MFFLYLLLFLIIIYSIFFLAQFFNMFFKGYAPVISTDKETIEKIIKESEIKDKMTIYELGCGRADFLRTIEKKFPKTNLIGVENLLSVYLPVKLKLKLQKSKIKILKKDIFTIDFKDADLIYCYLNNQTMSKLEKIFKETCRENTQIISRSFPLPKSTPQKTIKIKEKNIFFYKNNF